MTLVEEMAALERKAFRATNGMLKVKAGRDDEGREVFQYLARRPRGQRVLGPVDHDRRAALAGLMEVWNRNGRVPKVRHYPMPVFDLFGDPT